MSSYMTNNNKTVQNPILKTVTHIKGQRTTQADIDAEYDQKDINYWKRNPPTGRYQVAKIPKCMKPC